MTFSKWWCQFQSIAHCCAVALSQEVVAYVKAFPSEYPAALQHCEIMCSHGLFYLPQLAIPKKLPLQGLLLGTSSRTSHEFEDSAALCRLGLGKIIPISLDLSIFWGGLASHWVLLKKPNNSVKLTFGRSKHEERKEEFTDISCTNMA